MCVYKIKTKKKNSVHFSAIRKPIESNLVDDFRNLFVFLALQFSPYDFGFYFQPSSILSATWNFNVCVTTNGEVKNGTDCFLVTDKCKLNAVFNSCRKFKLKYYCLKKRIFRDHFATTSPRCFKPFLVEEVF